MHGLRIKGSSADLDRVVTPDIAEVAAEFDQEALQLLDQTGLQLGLEMSRPMVVDFVVRRVLQSLIELSKPGSEQRSLLESLSNHIGAKGARKKEEQSVLPGMADEPEEAE